MKNLMKLEELAMLLLSVYLFSRLSIAWWWFPALLLVPDLGALGYLFGNKAEPLLIIYFTIRAWRS